MSEVTEMILHLDNLRLRMQVRDISDSAVRLATALVQSTGGSITVPKEFFESMGKGLRLNSYEHANGSVTYSVVKQEDENAELDCKITSSTFVDNPSEKRN